MQQGEKESLNKKTLGESLTPLLEAIESSILDYEVILNTQPHFPINGFRAATKIFSTALMDKIYDLQCNEGMTRDAAIAMVVSAGEELSKLIKIYTGIDSHDFYKQ